MQIGTYEIGVSPPMIIAEMSGNHNQSLDRALAIVDQAAECGAHAIKLQTYTANTITLDSNAADFVIQDIQSPWHGANLHQLYSQAYTPWEWHHPIMERARDKGILCFSSPFDESAVDFLENLAVPAYKIASFELTHLPLIRKVAATGKPMILSTGMASIEEIDRAVKTARAAGNKDLALLKCTSTYPASPVNCNLRTLPHLRDAFDCHVGLSDHTMGVGVSVAAIALGAVIIEKHFTLDRNDGGVDSSFSMEPEELKALVAETERAWLSLGKITYGPTAIELKSLILRRSLYVAEAMTAGEVLTDVNLRCVRPGHGLDPKYFDLVMGKQVVCDVAAGTPLGWQHLTQSVDKI